MDLRQTARFKLRDATAQWHQRVDTVFSIANLADRAEYGQFLCAQAAALLPVERALDAGGMEEVIADWRVRRRAHLICEDLAALDLEMPLLEPDLILTSVAAMLGATYVLEGSRLGGTLLRRSVPASFPTAFLSNGGGTTTAWRDLIALLDARLAPGNELNAAIAAACDTFALFERSGQRLLSSQPLSVRTRE